MRCNPGNHKPVGGAGENPNGDGNWGPWDKGKSNANDTKGKPSATSKDSKSSKFGSWWFPGG